VNKISVIPFKENFLKRLAEEIVTRHYSPDDPLTLAQITVVLPHRRGIIYLRNYLFQLITARKRKPFVPPRIIAIEDWIQELAVQLERPPRRSLTPPDQAWILFGLVQGERLYGGVADSWDRFFPWGIRLSAILDDIDRELVIPKDIHYPEDVHQDARALLEGLEGIYTSFDQRLRTDGFTTPAKRMRLLAERIEEAAVDAHTLYLAGFYALTGAEERIFKHLFAEGARIFWHADPQKLPPLYLRWKKRWSLKIDDLGDTTLVPPRLHFYESFDLHSELLRVQEILPTEIKGPDQCALVLPDSSALIPTLYALSPQMSVNVSLGYPLERTALASLLEQLVRLQEGSNDVGAYYNQDYLNLIRHPYIRRLPTPSGKEGRIVLHLLEEKMRHYGKPFMSHQEIVDLIAQSLDSERDSHFLASEGLDVQESQHFVSELHRHLLTPWEDLHTPVEVVDSLKTVVRFLFTPIVEQEGFLLEHPFDNEFLYTLTNDVIPTLEDALFARSPMEKRLLFSLLREVIHMVRTPFEGHPLVGLQVLGLLETRLLSFETVIVIDVNEDVVPAYEEVNPLLPESLKSVFGLAGREREEAVIRYHFERLIACATDVHLLWQSSNLPTSSGIEGKKVRSRFIESLLWSEEKKRGAVLEDIVVTTPLYIDGESFLKEKGLSKTDREHQRVREFLSSWSSAHGLSATFLNSYLQCPLMFYYHYLLGMRPVVGVSEDVDAALLGEIVHQSLEEYFFRYRMRTYRKASENDPERLIAIFTHRFTESAMYRSLAPEKRFFLEYVARYRLAQYLSRMPENTHISALEAEYHVDLTLDPGEFTFYGKVDRIDIRDGYQIILDYKTGRLESFAKGHFEQKIMPFSLPAEFDHEGLKAVRGIIKDFQLPLYVFLVASGKEEDLGRTLSAYVELGRGGEERYFIPLDRMEKLRDDVIKWFSQTFPALLTYLIDHMIEAPYFYPATEERTCRFCEYESVCRFSLI
jgi:ATP-dependent helicase/nuclease subunit B